MRLWHFAQPDGSPPPLVALLLKYNVAAPNWLDTQFGMLGLKAAREQMIAAPIDPADHYCQPLVLDDLGPFMHTAMVAFGAANTSTAGFTMLTWVE